MKKNSLVLGLSILSFAATGQTTWVVDPVHSSVQFEVSHLAVSSVTGDFTGFTGSVITQNDDFNNARISATIDVNSVDTNNLERDKHLKEDDFFNASKYPNITFVSSVFSKEKDNIFTIQGDLTIRDVTKPISLSAEYGGIVSINGQQKAGFYCRRYHRPV